MRHKTQGSSALKSGGSDGGERGDDGTQPNLRVIEGGLNERQTGRLGRRTLGVLAASLAIAAGGGFLATQGGAESAPAVTVPGTDTSAAKPEAAETTPATTPEVQVSREQEAIDTALAPTKKVLLNHFFAPKPGEKAYTAEQFADSLAPDVSPEDLSTITYWFANAKNLYATSPQTAVFSIGAAPLEGEDYSSLVNGTLGDGEGNVWRLQELTFSVILQDTGMSTSVSISTETVPGGGMSGAYLESIQTGDGLQAGLEVGTPDGIPLDIHRN